MNTKLPDGKPSAEGDIGRRSTSFDRALCAEGLMGFGEEYVPQAGPVEPVEPVQPDRTVDDDDCGGAPTISGK
jgi:hypothetical protein